MSTRGVRHLEVREILADRITWGELRVGDRLPSERTLQEEFGYSRSVVRQALAALTSDGWIAPDYPRGYVVLGPRIPWLSRLRLLSDERWTAQVERAERGVASAEIARDLSITAGGAVAVRRIRLHGVSTDETLGVGAMHHPLDELGPQATRAFLSEPEITSAVLRAAFGRRVLGYRERIAARLPSLQEQADLGVAGGSPVMEVRRVDRTTTTPTSVLVFVGRSDRFEADYLIHP